VSENLRNTSEEIIINVQTSIQPTQWLGKMACSVEIRVSLTDKEGNCYMHWQLFSAHKSTANVRVSACLLHFHHAPDLRRFEQQS